MLRAEQENDDLRMETRQRSPVEQYLESMSPREQLTVTTASVVNTNTRHNLERSGKCLKK